MRQVPDEPDGVGQRVDAAVGGTRPAGGRVEGGEKRVLHQYPGTGQPVEQAGLAGVGVPGDRHRGYRVAPPPGPLGRADDPHGLDLALELRDPGADAATVGIHLGLIGTAQAHAAACTAAPAATTGLPGQRLAPTAQPGQEVLQLSQLDLGLALFALGVLGEDVQNQRGPVDHLDLGLLLQGAQLARGQLAVADHRVGTGVDHHVAQLGHLAATDERGGVRPPAPLDQPFEHLRAGGLGERGELDQGVLRVRGAALGPHPDQDHPFEAQLAVFDLGDVGEFGGQAGDAPQGVPLFQFKINIVGPFRRRECVSHVASIVTRRRAGRTTIPLAIPLASRRSDALSSLLATLVSPERAAPLPARSRKGGQWPGPHRKGQPWPTEHCPAPGSR